MLKCKTKLILLFTLLLGGVVLAQSSLPAIKIDNDDIKLNVGDTVRVSVVFIDEDENETDTIAVLSVNPSALGSFTGDGNFIADSVGKGWIYAVLDSLQDSVEVEIEETETEEPDFPQLVIHPDEYELSIGDSVLLSAFYMIDDSTSADSVISWSSETDSIAGVNENGLVIGLSAGKVKIIASSGSLTAKAMIHVKDTIEDSLKSDNNLIVEPKDTVISVGSTVAFSAFLKNEDGGKGDEVTGTVAWSLQGMPVGTISAEGELTADSAGFAIVTASLDDSSRGSAFVIVANTESDSVLNNITITKSSHNPRGYTTVKKLTEGERWVIGGLPSPMNVLNGGSIYFPVGSLHEDIRIHIDLPKFADSKGDPVTFGSDSILTAVNFEVYADDTLSEPYYFDTPLIASLIYKKGLLNKLGIEPEMLTLYYAEYGGDSLSYVQEGIEYTTVDPGRNLVHSMVAHFSTLIVKVKPNPITDTEENDYVVSSYKLEQNYPNPFNPSTTINYTIAGSSTEKVELVIFDLLGNKIKTLVSEYQPAGNYSVKWNAANLVSGIYFYQLKTKNFIRTNKMVLIK